MEQAPGSVPGVFKKGKANARFLLVEGMCHDGKQVQDHSARFFASLLK